MPHGSHIYAKALDITNATICTYPQSEHALSHLKCVLRCCADCPCINIPDQETTKKHEETTHSIRFHIYHIIGHCTSHGRISLKDKNICYMCEQKSLPDKSTKIYTKKRASDDGDNNIRFLYQFLHTRHPKIGLSSTTCVHTWYKSLWWNATHSLKTT